MDSKNLYLWGTLFALVREQLDAVDNQVGGRLGQWGKARFHSRSTQIQKFLFKLYERKFQTHGYFAAQALAEDLQNIEQNKNTWKGITIHEITYIRNMLSYLG